MGEAVLTVDAVTQFHHVIRRFFNGNIHHMFCKDVLECDDCHKVFCTRCRHRDVRDNCDLTSPCAGCPKLIGEKMYRILMRENAELRRVMGNYDYELDKLRKENEELRSRLRESSR